MSTKATLLVLRVTGSNSHGPHLHCSCSDSPQVYLGLGNKIDPYQFLVTNGSFPLADPLAAIRMFLRTRNC